MKKRLFSLLPLITSVAALCVLLFTTPAYSQTEDTSKVTIHFVNMETITVIKTDSGDYNRLNGNVILRQGTDTLYCDSALQNTTTKNFEAFSNVRIAQMGGTHGTSDYLKYTSANKEAFMRGNVHMTDGKNHLTCAELTYNLGTKVAVYDNGGKLYNDSTTVTSRWGEYNIQNKDARFKGKVVIIDTQYQIRSEDLAYNTETKLTQFYAKSVVTRDSGRSVLETADGSYDGKNGIAHFLKYSSIWNDGQYLESDSLLDYNKLTGYGFAYGRTAPDTGHHGFIYGHVISIDTAHHSTMFCGHAEYHKLQRTLLATIRPVLEQVNGKDTLYIRADTFYSAPMVKSQKPKAKSQKAPVGSSQFAVDSSGTNSAKRILKDSVAEAAYDLPVPVASAWYHVPVTKEAGNSGIVAAHEKPAKPEKRPNKKSKRDKDTGPAFSSRADTAGADTTAPLYFIGYHHVLIFSDSIQGKCDSVCYTRADSLIRMMYNPIVWAHKSQITGDTIIMQLDSSTLRKMFVPNNSFLVSQSGPDKAHLYDQVQGKTLTAYFKSNTITNMIVKPDAESIYYNKDEKGYYLGVSQSTSDRMFVWFDDQKIKSIKLDGEPHTTDTPLEKADLPNTKLGKFKWLIDQRPKSKEELFR